MKFGSNLSRSLFFLLFAFFIISCSDSNAPGATAEKFMTHISKGEFKEAKQYASKPTGELVEMMGQMGAALGSKMKHDEDFNFILESETVNDDKAVVTFRKKEGGDIETVNLIKEDGDWKVHEEKK